MSFLRNLINVKEKILTNRNLKSVFDFLLQEIENTKGNLHLANIFEIISDELEKIQMHSIICIINDKRNEVVVRRVNFPGELANVFTTKNLKKIDFKKFNRYQEVIKKKKPVFCNNRLSQLKKVLPKTPALFEGESETNSIIVPLVLRGEIIGTLEIFSKKLEREDLEIVDSFVKKLVISITNNILFHEIRESEQRYHDLFKNASDGLVFFNIDEKSFRESNLAMKEISGYTAEELKQLHYLRLFEKNNRKRLEEMITSIKNNKNPKFLPIKLCLKLLTKNSKIKTTNVEIGLQSKGEELYFSFQDITEKKKIETALKESEEKYRTLVNNAADGVLTLNLKGEITLINKAMAKILEYEKEEVVGSHFSRYVYKDDLGLVSSRYRDRVSGKDVVSNYDFRIVTKGGQIKYINYSGTLIRKNGKRVGIQAITRDISKRREMKERIQSTKRHYKSIIDSIQDDIIVIGEDYDIVSCNQSFAKNVGINIGKIQNKKCKEIFPKYKRGVLNAHCFEELCEDDCSFLSIFKTGKPLQFTEKGRNEKGVVIFNAVSVFPIKNKGKTYQAVIIIRDITETKIAEEENLRLTEFNKKIVDSSPVSIIVLDKNGRIILTNGMAKELIGESDNSLLGVKLVNTKEIKKTKNLQKKYKHLLQDGTSFYYDNLSYYNNGQNKYLNIIAVPLYSADKQIDGAISMAIDNTEKVIAKQTLENLNKKLEEKVKSRTDELDKSNKELSKVLELKSKFISDASHELRTPLTIIQGNLDLAIQEAISKKKDTPEALDLISKEVEQMTGILTDLTLLTNADASSETINYDNIDLKLLVVAVVQSLEVLAGQKNISLKIKNGYKNIYITGDETKLEKLLLNIVRNAIKYTDDNGKIEVWVEKNKNKAKIFIKDNGLGIPDNDLPYIFERFYRVDKARSRSEGGTGLGLSICKWIAEAHGGSISVESKVGIGSTFTVALPLEIGE